jgi:hypothetical protein
MTATNQFDSAKLLDARSWLSLLVADDSPNDADNSLIVTLETYIGFLEQQQGIRKSFANNIAMRRYLKVALHNMNLVIDYIAEIAPEDPIPEDCIARALLQFLGLAALDMTLAIGEIEQQYPDFGFIFEEERKQYALGLEGKAALDNWIHSDEKPDTDTEIQQ